jgi:hypothetical protein
MSDKTQFKVQGLQFARSLQMLIKMVNMFSVDHKSAGGMLRRSYDILNPLLKKVRYLTIGFVEQRVLLNNILTAESSLKPLENELLKRGIGAISFDAGITFAAFVKAVGAIAAHPKIIQENGGLMPFLESKQLEFVRVFPAGRNEIRNDDGDTVLEMGSEEYLISKALSNLQSVPSQGIEGILGRLEAAGTGTGSGSGSGFSGNGASGENVSSGSAVRTDVMASVGRSGSSNAVSSTGSNLGHAAGPVDQLQKIADQKFEASLRNPQEDPQKAYAELGRILTNLRPDGVLKSLPGGADGLLNAVETKEKEEVTAEVFEDSALRWALKRLAGIPTGGDAVIVEEQVFRVLMRSLQATNAASRLAQKLADFAKDYVLPKQTLERLHEEVRWLTLSSHSRLRELLSVEHFTASQFRRGLDLIKDLIRMGSQEGAEALGIQYFSIFEDYASIRIEEVGRIPDLLRALAGVQGDFWTVAKERLTEALSSGTLNLVIHVQVVNALVALARVEATYEKFMVVRQVGDALERNAVINPAVHTSCCRSALSLMLEPSAVDRITEMFLDLRHDSEWTRTATVLLRWADANAIERIFTRLDTEPVAGNRLALIRLLGRVGPNGLAAARRRLTRPEWYVVRNACKLLAELKDPDLLEQLLPVFSYPDERVQKTALQAVKRTHLPGRQLTIAKVLPSLPASLFEEALDELTFKPDAAILPFLEDFLSGPMRAGDKAALRMLRVLATIEGPQALEALERISANEKLDASVRHAALGALRLMPNKKFPAHSASEMKRPPELSSDLIGTS